MKNNYPIKYAVMPIYEQVGWNHGLNELEREYDVVSCIVSKCFVVSDATRYEMDGTVKRECQVVFPYRNDEFGRWIRTEPRYGFHKQVNNDITVNDVYDSYEDALKEANLKNEEIKKRKLGYLPVDEKINKTIEELIQNHEAKLSMYKNIEKQIEENTPDLKVDERPNEQSIIVIYDEENKKINGCKDKLIDISLYNYINLNDYGYFYVCNVSKENYELMKKQLEETGKIDEEKLGIENRYLLANDREKRNIRIVDFDSQKEKGCYYLTDNRYLKYDENMPKFYQEEKEKFVKGMKVYTIETYEDIITSYIPKFISKGDEPIEIEGKTIRKKLVLK